MFKQQKIHSTLLQNIQVILHYGLVGGLVELYLKLFGGLSF